jgi:hypothetical protein
MLIKLLQEINNTENDQPDARRYFQTELRKAAEEIVHFMSSLQSANFREFWLPCAYKRHFSGQQTPNTNTATR